MRTHGPAPYFSLRKAYISGMSRTSRPELELPDLFGVPAVGPAGFRYQPDLVTPQEEAILVPRLQELPLQPFEFFGHLGNRRVTWFGERYDYGDGRIHAAAPIPAWLESLKVRAAEFAGLSPNALKQALVTEYTPGAGIGWHKDRPVYEDVIGISFVNGCVLRLRQSQGQGWDRHNVTVPPRSAYLFRGEVRDAWEHSIAPMPALRYSITFRSLRDR
jgi:alkylated DNA repair dioxygenase AlkB